MKIAREHSSSISTQNSQPPEDDVFFTFSSNKKEIFPTKPDNKRPNPIADFLIPRINQARILGLGPNIENSYRKILLWFLKLVYCINVFFIIRI